MPKKYNTSKKPAQLRIIGGKWRGRKLAIADVEGLRPTGDRIRETLFNWLQQDIVDARCLDLFAGSGALGLEALSRGAHSVTLIEQNPKAASNLANHCQLLAIAANECDIVQDDAISWLTKTALQPASIDIVFIDPPFAADLWQTTIATLQHTQCLAENALVYSESPKNTPISAPLNWQLHREKTAGDVSYRLYKVSPALKGA